MWLLLTGSGGIRHDDPGRPASVEVMVLEVLSGATGPTCPAGKEFCFWGRETGSPQMNYVMMPSPSPQKASLSGTWACVQISEKFGLVLLLLLV